MIVRLSVHIKFDFLDNNGFATLIHLWVMTDVVVAILSIVCRSDLRTILSLWGVPCRERWSQHLDLDTRKHIEAGRTSDDIFASHYWHPYFKNITDIHGEWKKTFQFVANVYLIIQKFQNWDRYTKHAHVSTKPTCRIRNDLAIVKLALN